MRDLLAAYERLSAGRMQVGRAVVTSVWGSAPAAGRSRDAGHQGWLRWRARSPVDAWKRRRRPKSRPPSSGGSPSLVTFGVSHQEAWAVGLACGGTIKIFVEPRRPPRDPRGRSRAGRRGGRDDHRGPGYRRRASDLRRRHGGAATPTCPTTPSEMPRWPRSGGRRAGPSPWTCPAGRHRCSWRCFPDSPGWSSSAPRTSPWRSCRSPAGSAIAPSWPTAESDSSPGSVSRRPTS